MIAITRALDLRSLLDPVVALPTFGADAAALPAWEMVPILRPALGEADPGSEPADIPAPAADNPSEAAEEGDDTADYWIGVHDPVGDARRQLAGYPPVSAAEGPAQRAAIAFASYRLKAGILAAVLAIGAALSMSEPDPEDQPIVATVQAGTPAAVTPDAEPDVEPAAAVEVPAAEANTAEAHAAATAAVPTSARVPEAFVSSPVPRAQ